MTSAELVKKLKAERIQAVQRGLSRDFIEGWNNALAVAIHIASQGDVEAGLRELAATNICPKCGLPTEGVDDRRDGSQLCWCHYEDIGAPDIAPLNPNMTETT